MTQHSSCEEVSNGELGPLLTHIFPWAPKNSSQTKVLSCTDSTGHTSRGDEGFGGTKLSFTAPALRPGESREAGHLIPASASVMGKWKSHSEKKKKHEGGRVDWKREEKVRKNEQEIKRQGEERGQQVKSEKEEEQMKTTESYKRRERHRGDEAGMLL